MGKEDAALTVVLTNEDGELETRQDTTREAMNMMVKKVGVSTGFLEVVDEVHGIKVHDADRDPAEYKFDVVRVELTTFDNDIASAYLPWAFVIQLASKLADWLDELHEQGRCKCGDERHNDGT